LLMIFSGLKIAQAQQGFDIRDSIFLGQICHYSVEFPDGYLLCYGMPGEFTYPYTENLFLLSKDGSRVEEINFLTSNTQRILPITKWKNSQEWLFDMETKDTQTGK